MSSSTSESQLDCLPHGLRKAIAKHLETKTGQTFGNFIIKCKKQDIEALPADYASPEYRYSLTKDGQKQLRNLIVSTRKVFDSAKLSQQDIFESGEVLFLRLQAHLIRQMREFNGHPYMRAVAARHYKMSMSFITHNERRRSFDTVLDGQLDFGFIDKDMIQKYDHTFSPASRQHLEQSLEILFDDLGGEVYAKWDAMRGNRSGTPFFDPDLGDED